MLLSEYNKIGLEESSHLDLQGRSRTEYVILINGERKKCLRLKRRTVNALSDYDGLWMHRTQSGP